MASVRTVTAPSATGARYHILRESTILPAMRSLPLAVAILSLAPSLARADEADVRYRAGLTFKQQNRLDEAITEFEQAIKLRGDYAAAEFSLGVVFKMRNQLDKAIPHL